MAEVVKKVVILLSFLLVASCLMTRRVEGRQADALHRLKKVKREGRVERIRSFPGAVGEEDLDSLASVQSLSKIVASPQEGLKEADRIDRLPGQPEVNFDQYAGYITVHDGRALFYYFVEAVGFNSLSKPLLLWLNGGPGCSSLGYGAMEELGPFRVASDGQTLYRNWYSWNNVANVLFLESPAGVGYSYSNVSDDYKSFGDRRTALDNYVFLVNWLERFPEYKKRDFYIAGESYAGNYVPQLAHLILQNNKWAKRTVTINLKGITIGNAVLNDDSDDKGMYDYFWTHALIPDETIHAIHENCFPAHTPKEDDKCKDEQDKAWDFVDPIDIYNIYAPLCHDNATKRRPSLANFDPCSDNYVEKYLNLPSVQKAFHANVSGIIKYPWVACSNTLTKWTDSADTVLPLLREFMDYGLRVWVFSGDTDGRVPVTSTRYSLSELKLPVATKWYPWAFNGEVGGYTLRYKGNLTFVTVRGAGHEVPSYQPARALSYFEHFLRGTPLPLFVSDDN